MANKVIANFLLGLSKIHFFCFAGKTYVKSFL